MYHCGTDPVLHHIANGMFGMVIVEPTGGLEPMENEFFMVQHEWYLGPQGEVSSFGKANQAAPAPDFVMFNGAAFQYRDTPIEVPTGEQFRSVRPQRRPVDRLVVPHRRHDLRHRDQRRRQARTRQRGQLGLPGRRPRPAQGAVIELLAAEDGLYPMVTHAFNFPGRGALGLFQAGDGEP